MSEVAWTTDTLDARQARLYTPGDERPRIANRIGHFGVGGFHRTYQTDSRWA